MNLRIILPIYFLTLILAFFTAIGLLYFIGSILPKNIHEKQDRMDLEQQKSQILESMKEVCPEIYSSYLKQTQKDCTKNNCSLSDLTLYQLRDLNRFSENAISLCIKLQSEIESKQKK